jgi:hypothetical protein
LCCPLGSSGTTAASDAHPARHPLPGITGYKARRSDDAINQMTADRRAGEGLPSSRRHRLNVPRPHTPRSSSRLHPRLFTASMLAQMRCSRDRSKTCSEGKDAAGVALQEQRPGLGVETEGI